MHWFYGYFKSKERLAILITTFVLTGFVCFLLAANYRSLQRLRESSLRQHQYEIDKRARDLTHFFKDQRRNISSLVEDGKIRSYFENKALGMSMEYGLRSTMMTMGDVFADFVSSHRIGDDWVYYRVAFIDAQGNAIVDTGSSQGADSPFSDYLKMLLGLPDGYFVCVNTDQTQQEILYTQPFFFKERYAGQIVAWLEADAIYQQLRHIGQASRFSGLICRGAHVISAKGLSQVGDATGRLQFILTESDLTERIEAFGRGEKVFSLRATIGGTAFDLVEIASSKAVLGATSPQTLLLAMALLALALLGGAAIVVRMITHNMVLQTRVEESQKREAAIAQKNVELEAHIEERKRSEAERIRLEGQLRRAHKMEAIGMLAGGVAHDLNNILSGLVSYPELLLMDLPEDSSMRSALITIQKSGEKAATIVQDLLTLARRGVATTEVLELNRIILDYIGSPEHEKLLQFHPRVRLDPRLAPELLNIMGSPVHLSKTVMNLISNAAEAMPDGGRIIVSTENRYIDRPIRGYDKVEEGDYVILRVADRGIGIPPKDLERIFEPFYTKKVMGRSGTGLGMAVVWGTVKDHNGYIDVESDEGDGTVFTLYFPVTRKVKAIDAGGFRVEDFKGAGESILVVDDVEEQRRIATGMLEKLGYKVVTSPSGENAVAYLSERRVDLLVVDMIMDPGIDGLETYRQVLQRHPGQRAIIASGFSETDRVKEAQRLGAGGYIRKPYTLEVIGRAVRSALAA